MKSHARKKWLAGVVLLSAASIWMGCQNPFECKTNMPETGILTVKLTINEENPEVPITVYYGDVEHNDVAVFEYVSRGVVQYELWVNEEYTVEAWYSVGEDTVVVIDADDITVDLDEDKSTEYTDCWGEVDNANVDVRLKFDSLPDRN
jgi:hypothetical protein